jgi:hypothetical protein
LGFGLLGQPPVHAQTAEENLPPGRLRVTLATDKESIGSGTATAAGQPGAGSQKKGEIALMAGAVRDADGAVGPLGSVGLGWHVIPALEIEPSVAFVIDDAIAFLNVNANLPAGRLVPYLSGGFGACVHGAPFANAGGGLRIKIRERLSFRAELRYYSWEDEGSTHSGGAFLAGVSRSF